MECDGCGVAICDLPYEELGMDIETAKEMLFTSDGSRTYCMGCVQIVGEGEDD